MKNFKKFLSINFYLSFTFLIIGITTITDKKISAPFYSPGFIFDLGNYAYIIGSFLVLLGVYILDYEYKRIKGKEK